MVVIEFVEDGPRDAERTLVLAHGAGAPMDAPGLATIATGIAAAGIRVRRFEFPYMAAARREGRRHGPDREPVLLATWRAAIEVAGPVERLFVGGRSMGGRIASMVADEAGVAGVVCFGYPFHPPGKPERLRTAHLEGPRTPTLIVQGERDPFGSRAEVEGYRLSKRIRVLWLPDADHSLPPRRASGYTEAHHLRTAIAAAVEFVLANSRR